MITDFQKTVVKRGFFLSISEAQAVFLMVFVAGYYPVGDGRFIPKFRALQKKGLMRSVKITPGELTSDGKIYWYYRYEPTEEGIALVPLLKLAGFKIPETYIKEHCLENTA